MNLSGPDVALSLSHAEAIGLALHELTTNALKFGALRGAGRIEIRWQVDADHNGQRVLDLTWIESGVPAVSATPSHRGFGREWIEEALPYRHGATTSFVVQGGGVRCSIRLPLTTGDG